MLSLNFLLLPFTFFLIFLVYMYNSIFMLNSSVCYLNVFYDEISLFIVFMTLFVIFSSLMFCIRLLNLKLVVTLLFMLVICLLVFTTRSMFLLYLYYEASLLPILYIIIKWGSYPERSVRSIILLLYTAVFTFPFVYILFSFYRSFNSFSFMLLNTSLVLSPSLFTTLFIFITFAVKLPIYGLHFWLPIAHVEAPTFGSIILAGVLLKLGGVGLLRFASLIDISMLKTVILGYFMVFLCYVTLICCFQSDFKRLVAYSSVSHMITIPIILFSSRVLSFKGVISIIFLHGVSSPLLFSLVGIVYSMTSTRQHILIRGLASSNPLVLFFMVLSFFFSLSAPPYPSFISEVFFSISSLYIWEQSFYFVVIFLFLSIVYNLLWVTSARFFTQDSYQAYCYIISYSSFLSIFLSLFTVPFLFTILFFNIL